MYLLCSQYLVSLGLTWVERDMAGCLGYKYTWSRKAWHRFRAFVSAFSHKKIKEGDTSTLKKCHALGFCATLCSAPVL